LLSRLSRQNDTVQKCPSVSFPAWPQAEAVVVSI
jgi:hypothetical protein